MVVRLLAIVRAAAVSVVAVVPRGVAHEAVLKGFVPFLVPLEVTYHLLLLQEDAGIAIQTVEMLPARKEEQEEPAPLFSQFSYGKL